jgi:cytochrome P450
MSVHPGRAPHRDRDLARIWGTIASARSRPRADGLPPGPRTPAPWQTLRLARDWVGFLQDCRRRYGDTFTVNFSGFGPTLYVSDPDVASAVMQGDPDVFQAGPARAILEPVVGRRSVLVLDGEEHLRERTLLLPSFQGNHVRVHERMMEEITEADVAGWPRGERFALRPHLQAITLEVIVRAVFGIADPAARARLRPALTRLLDAGTWVSVLPVLPDRLEEWARRMWLDGRRRAVDDQLYAHIAARRANGDGTHDDVLALLMSARDEDGRALDDEALRDELVTVLTAGHETTANALAWAFERLVRHPEAMARLLAELDDDPAGGPYLDAVVRETLRVRPVLGDTGRILASPAEVDGWQVPAGIMVAPALCLVNLDPDVHPDAEAFRPERWLDGSPPPRSWIPFGAGRRSCLGAGFAMFEMKVVIRTVLRRLALRQARPGDERMKLRNITLTPGRGAEVIAAPR